MSAATVTPQSRDSEGLGDSQSQISGQDEPTLFPSGWSGARDDVSQPEADHDPTSSSLQKRRRVTRACDECRKKKIRCDGKQPCTHCTVYSYECSYDQPSNRRRNPAPVFLEAMEKKLRRAESLLQLCFPGVALDDPRFDILLQHGSLHEAGLGTKQLQSHVVQPHSGTGGGIQDHDSDLESMVASKGALNQDGKGEYAYYGASSGMNFLRRMSEEFGQMAKAEGHEGSLPSDATLRRMSNVMMEIPGQSDKQEAFSEHDISIDDLPPKGTAMQLIRYALDDACAILPCVHKPSFYQAVDRIFDLPSENYSTQDHRFLPLLYVVIALGCLFAKDGESKLERGGYLSATDEGYKYFGAARQLIDVTDCRDLVSLQAIIFMILFLQCSAKLATCYAFIGVAVRIALRMGMHRSFKDSFNPIESEVRKRCFWIIRKMDVMVSAMLGLPLTLSDHDIDQDFPTEVDDEYITMEGIQAQPKDVIPMIAAVNHDFRLTNIVCKIVRRIYPLQGLPSVERQTSRMYRVRLSVVRDIESDLKAWEDNLQPMFKPGLDAPPQLVRIRNLLRMGFAYVQMMLYRPFLHYVSSRSHPRQIHAGSQACAAACVHVSRNIIHITASMNQNGLLVGSYWFTMYSCFFAVLSLVFYALENTEASKDFMNDAIVGRQTLATLAKRSMAADRCTATLTVLFDQISSKLNNKDLPKRRGASSKKRDNSQVDPIPSQLSVTMGSINVAKDTTRPEIYPRPVQTNRVQPQIAPRPRNPEPVSSSAMQQSSLVGTRPPQNTNFPTQTQLPLHLQSQSPSVMRMAPFAVPTHHDFQHPEAEHFSSMMFPSPDPFAYPNQPMLALDQSGSLPKFQGGAVGHPDTFVRTSTAPANNAHADEFVDVDMLGIPNYPSLQHDQSSSNAGLVPGVNISAETNSIDQRSVDGVDNPFPGFDFGDFFGSGDWRQRM